MEGEQTHGRKAATRALATSGFPVLGVMIGNLLTRGFSWWDLVALALIWVFLFSLALFFYSRRDRFGRNR